MDIVHYGKAYYVNVAVDSRYNTITVFNGGYALGRSSFGRMAVIQPITADSPALTIRYNTLDFSPCPGNKLYFSKSSKMPRDLARNTGYQIVRDPSAADYTVIPLPEDPDPYSAYVFMKTADNEFYIVNVYDKAGGKMIVTPEMLAEIEGEIRKKYDVAQFWSYLQKQWAYLIKDVDEYEDILLHNSNKKYVRDDKILFMPSTVLNPETLDIIRRNPSKEQALKLLMQTDFQKYPLTVCMFLANDLNVDYGYKYGDQVNWMMRCINYDRFEDDVNLNDPVTPEDFALLQDWILYQLNLNDTGLVSVKSYSNLNYRYKDFIQTKIALKRTELKGPMSFKDLKSMVKNLA